MQPQRKGSGGAAPHPAPVRGAGGRACSAGFRALFAGRGGNRPSLPAFCLAVLLAIAAPAADGPSYELAGFRNASNLSQGPFAPNTVVSVYGTGLAWSTYSLTSADIASGYLPTTLNGVQVTVNDVPAPLFMVSAGQVNFLMPTNLLAGSVAVRVVRQGVAGPDTAISVQDAAPALYPLPEAPGYAIAQRWPEYSLITPSVPIAPGDIVILYAAGLGRTRPYPSQASEIPAYAALLEALPSFRVYLDGKALDASKVLYAGLAPGWASLYQVNLVLPEDVGPDPEIRLAVGNQTSRAGVRLAVQSR